VTEHVNIMGELVAEVRRVATLREQWAQIGRSMASLGSPLTGFRVRIDVAPAMALMDAALDRAAKAAASGEAHDILVSLLELREFKGD
jgi:hypothetical protein